ncbi:MAG: Cobyrinic acid ac-diamide synthase [Desulfotomaculum sp. 46_296]|nr:MAG: Cobyrinic acid ac-diamide synthase [Desulfotomaculum sp. 46_296]HAU31966.1 carbon monoxide dehydrogenase [Desulfotomaculum sp.]
MSFTIAVAGKGGTGKTTLAALLIRQLIKSGRVPVLAVDADANANLNEALGIKVGDQTISSKMPRINNSLEPLPAGMTRERYLAYCVHKSLAEGDDFDLLVMGGPQGQGCYCYVNNLLRGFVRQLSSNYPYIVIDNEAGMEHLSRQTTNNVDILFITSDATVRGIRSAKRIKELVENLSLAVRNMYLVINRTAGDFGELLKEEIARTGLTLIGTIPEDEQVVGFDLVGRPIFELPDESPVVKAVSGIMSRTKIIEEP